MTGRRPLLRDDLALLLRAALHPDATEARAAYAGWRRDADLVELDPAALTVAGLLAERLEELGARDDRAARLILWRVRFTWLRAVEQRKRLAPVLAALHEAGVRAMLIKGPAVLHHVGGPTSWRPMEDLDVLVAPAQLRAAAAVLEAHGFSTSFGPGFAVAPERFAARHAAPYADGAGAEIDLHWRGAHLERAAATEARRFTGAIAAELLGAPVLVPRVEETLLLAVEHGEPAQGTASATWAADVALLLRDGPPIDWPEVAALAAERRLGGVVGDALDAVEAAAGIAAPPAARAALGPARPTLVQRWRGRRPGGRAAERVTGALEQLERHALLAARPRLSPADVPRAVARTYDLPAATAALPYAAFAASGRRRALRDRLVAPRPAPDAPRAAVDLASDGDPEGWRVLRTGWSAPEPFGTWIAAPYALAVLPAGAHPGRALALQVEGGSYAFGPGQDEVRFRVLVDDVTVDAWRLTRESNALVRRIEVPPGIVRGGAVAVAFVPDRLRSPAELGLGLDRRRLAAWIRRIAVL